MHIRERSEQREVESLSPYASLSRNSLGRARPEPPCEVRTSFQVDRDRILHCKAFRRLKYKTQVFLAPEGDHYRTRLTHTLEVSQIARTIARALSLNEDLVEAIALGHDLGHTPFGHAGERVLNKLVAGGFRHVLQSRRVVEHLEKGGAGLNLTSEVIDGISRHSKGGKPLHLAPPEQLPHTLEGQVVRISDIIAYVNHDLDDALRAGMVLQQDIPTAITGMIGDTHALRINSMVMDLIETSLEHAGAQVKVSDGMSETIAELRSWLNRHVYQAASVDCEFSKAERILEELFSHFVADPMALQTYGGICQPTDPLEVSVTDFLAGMTDRYAINLFNELFMPRPWRGL